MLYDRFVNSSGWFLVPQEETGSRFFVCSTPFCLPKLTHYHLASNADSGHSDLEYSLEDQDDHDIGMPFRTSLELPST
jgi:hypothetical protein